MGNIKQVVIPAAGLGSRLDCGMPKCMLEINGKKIIDYIFDCLEDVPHVRMVVGFKADEIINYVIKRRPDVTFVRNPDFENTSCNYSLWLGSRDISGAFCTFDSDTIIPSGRFAEFDRCCHEGESVLAVIPVRTEYPIYAHIENGNTLSELSLERKSDYEWGGLVWMNGGVNPRHQYVYQNLNDIAPLPAILSEYYEIDTARDYLKTVESAVAGAFSSFTTVGRHGSA